MSKKCQRNDIIQKSSKDKDRKQIRTLVEVLKLLDTKAIEFFDNLDNIFIYFYNFTIC